MKCCTATEVQAKMQEAWAGIERRQQQASQHWLKLGHKRMLKLTIKMFSELGPVAPFVEKVEFKL